MADERPIKVTTPLGEDVLSIESMTGEEALGMPFSYRLELVSQDPSVDMDKLLGQPVTVQVKQFDESLRYFNGLVSRFALVGAFGNHVRYEATVRPWLWFLRNRTNCRIFQEKKIPDIIQAIFREHGFTDFENKLTGTYAQWEYCVQYRESDFNFVSRLMEQEGIYYYFKHTDSKHTLVLADALSAHEPAPGYESVTYHPHSDGVRFGEDHIDEWSVSREVQSGGYASTDYDFKRPKANLQAIRKAAEPHALADFEAFDYPGEYHTTEEGEAHVRVRVETLQANFEVVEASATARGLTTGCLFKMTEFPREDQNKEYLLTGASYRLRTNPFEAGASDGSDNEFRIDLHAIDSQRPFRAQQRTPRPVVEGPQTAVVVGKEGEEIWTDEFARVKVQFHWDREGKSDENSSCWMRVAQTWASKRWGTQFIPRMGQEVLVEFLEGDPDQPLVTGCVYNGDNMPPYTVPANATQSGIKTQSSKGGSPSNYNEIRFEDKKGAEELYFQAEKDQNTYVKNNQGITVDANRTVTVKGTQTTTVTKKDTVTVQDEREETITKKVTETYQAEHAMSVTGPQTIAIEKDKTEHVTGAYDLTTDKRFNLTQGGTKLTFEGNKVTLDAASQITVTRGPANVTIDDSGKVVISTPAGISFQCGGSSITLSATGITLSAMQVGISVAASSFQVNPEGVQVNGAMVDVKATGMCNITGVGMLNLNSA